jgi:hypothetical protein
VTTDSGPKFLVRSPLSSNDGLPKTERLAIRSLAGVRVVLGDNHEVIGKPPPCTVDDAGAGVASAWSANDAVVSWGLRRPGLTAGSRACFAKPLNPAELVDAVGGSAKQAQ